MQRPAPIPDAVLSVLKSRLGATFGEYRIPPPVLSFMCGEFIEFDPEAARLTTQFPIVEDYLNPYGAMQGGMIAAAVDNTLGPLSMLVAPPNVTRRLEMTYSRPVTLEMGHLVVIGRLLERRGRQLHFAADVLTGDGTRLARATATHWVVGEAEPKPRRANPARDPEGDT